MTLITLSDQQIAELIATPKRVINPGMKPKLQKASIQVTYELEEVHGGRRFLLYLRSNPRDPESFSCGLAYVLDGPDKMVTLCRYNGSNHVHYNPIESGEQIAHQCHIHTATQRYMEIGDKCDKFAESTDRYSDFDGAVSCILQDCSITGLHQSAGSEDKGGQLNLW
ncbi:hypothetical protein KRX52_04300 [Pseudomonas sp. MAP12]|uniref:Uncharacterized protein n=1 Tax=Geopseudomonas aromaticivorans TaxID=2849492 RepID=A0ABS6MUC6_9GAMM|nr:hypothetical protein [Pseudomonas aromaticivorans]MBV2132019.1 hypothetical protein [Pseudomonas aromaticivorans]